MPLQEAMMRLGEPPIRQASRGLGRRIRQFNETPLKVDVSRRGAGRTCLTSVVISLRMKPVDGCGFPRSEIVCLWFSLPLSVVTCGVWFLLAAFVLCGEM